MSDYSMYTEDELASAQSELDRLCKKHDVQPFTLGEDKTGFKRLVDVMIGLEQRPVGRPEILSKKTREDFIKYMQIIDDFPEIDESGNFEYTTKIVREKVAIYSEPLIKKGLYPSEFETPEEFQKFLETLWNNRRKRTIDEIEKEELEARTKEDWA